MSLPICAWMLLALLAGALPCFAQDSPVVPPALAVDSGERPRSSPERAQNEGGGPKPVATNHQMLHKYVWSTLGLEGAIHATLASGLEQWRGAPPEWGGDATGYAKRWASEFGEAAVGDTTKYLVARLFHHDPAFTRCDCSGFARRLGHAASSPFMARTRHGRRVPSPATVASVLASHVVPASTWYPAPGGARDGLKHAASGVVGKIAVNVLREFWPRRTK